MRSSGTSASVELYSDRPTTGSGIHICSSCKKWVSLIAWIRYDMKLGTKRAKTNFIFGWHAEDCEWLKNFRLRRERIEALRRANDRFDAQASFNNF